MASNKQVSIKVV